MRAQRSLRGLRTASHRRAGGPSRGLLRGSSRVAVLAGALSSVLVSGCAGEAPPEGRDKASVTLEPCGAVLADAHCGVVSVPEDRSEPTGRRIDLRVVVAPATGRDPAPDPVFLLAGGPGQGAASFAGQLAPALAEIRRARDLVFVDLRGTGSSQPLVCAFEDYGDLHELLGNDIALERIDDCLADYARTLGEVDLSQYTTPTHAEDLDEVRAALGYREINLLGISYGTRLALVYMRAHPDHVRASVLDGVAPPDINFSLAMPKNAEQSLRAVLADCEAQPACARAFPGLERKLLEVLARLGEARELREVTHPRTGAVERVDVSPAALLAALRLALYSGEASALIPWIIDRAHAGDFGPMAAMLVRMEQVSQSMSSGLYFSVSCAEDLAQLTPERRAGALAGQRLFTDATSLEQLEAVCARWPHADLDAVAPDFREPVVSDVPTLLLSGRYDPVTPPSMAEATLAHLGHARHLVVESAHHGVWSRGCAPALMAEFFASADPEASSGACLDTMTKPPFFLSAAGPRSPLAQGAQP
ncbi:alpha/beta fold hydrolase [Pseudenhygromyxa sp. WMMC2535]|uniref:alpha/beta fold hydrolase n=1 Tax=Pseudenhygromyxa sp. WMMC2535 TaxID=2712867 RepID=UPI001595DDF2|nr:alpha/beta fold hydrolase [Pseudenhygromyxa sp. WMMC2535]NVB40552.1 alpha/beta fold hydrolase [Pseudenhygromyxa sp. WMMC2535]